MPPVILLSSLLWGSLGWAEGIPSAPILSFSLDVVDVEGVEPVLLQQALVSRRRMTACYVQGAAPAGQPQPQGEMVLRVRWTEGAAEIVSRRQDDGLQGIADCLAHFLADDTLDEIAGEAQATVRYHLRYEAGRPAAPSVVLGGGLRPWEGAVPLVAEVRLTVTQAEGLSTDTVAELLEVSRPAVEACYQESLGGPVTVSSGQVLVAARWERHLTSTQVLSHSGGLDTVSTCLAGVVQAVSALEAARSSRKGASAEISFDLRARPGSL